MTLVLVTGGTGHLGHDLVDRLVRDRHQVRVFARVRRARADVEWAIGDLATGEGLPTALRGVHTVINAALMHWRGEEFFQGSRKIAAVER